MHWQQNSETNSSRGRAMHSMNAIFVFFFVRAHISQSEHFQSSWLCLCLYWYGRRRPQFVCYNVNKLIKLSSKYIIVLIYYFSASAERRQITNGECNFNCVCRGLPQMIFECKLTIQFVAAKCSELNKAAK